MSSQNGSHEGYPASSWVEDVDRRTSVSISGNYVGVQEHITIREFDAMGQLRFERTERRSYVAPVTSVPADRFVPYRAPVPVNGGDDSALRRLVASLELPERADVR